MDREPPSDLDMMAQADSSFGTASVDTANCAALGVVRLTVRQGRLDATLLFEKLLVSRVILDAYQTRTQPDGVKRVGQPWKGAEIQ